MRRLIVLGTLLAFSAFAVVNAQATKDQPKADPQKVTVTKQDVPQKSTTPSAAIKESPVTRPAVTSQQKAATIKPVSDAKPVVKMEKYGPHAPEFNDPDYHQKLSEWMRNYPDEFTAYKKAKLTK